MKGIKIRKLLLVPVLGLMFFSCGSGTQNEVREDSDDMRMQEDEMMHEDGHIMGEDSIHEDDHMMDDDSIMMNTQ